MNFGSILNPQDNRNSFGRSGKEESEDKDLGEGNEESEEEEEDEVEFKQIPKVTKQVQATPSPRPTRQSNLRTKVINSKILQEEEDFFPTSPPSPSKTIKKKSKKQSKSRRSSNTIKQNAVDSRVKAHFNFIRPGNPNRVQREDTRVQLAFQCRDYLNWWNKS